MLDPTMSSILESLAGSKPMHEMSLGELREFIAPVPVGDRRAVDSTEDLIIDNGIAVRVYRPTVSGFQGVLVYFHGGGFVSGSVESHDNVARELCEVLGCVTVSVEYRLAPEHRFPAASNDCLGAVRWAMRHVESLGGVKSAGVVVCGDSAGANLAAVTCLRLRDSGESLPAGQVLIYPVTDYHTPPTQSYLENGDGYMLTRGAMINFWRGYILSDADAKDPYAAPLKSQDFSGLPPALVITAEYDPLRDEGEAYASRLKRAGVHVQVSRYDGLLHGFMRMASSSPRAASSFLEIKDWVLSLDSS